MHTFVTGATGLLGGNLVRQLIAQGHTVTALARSREKAERHFAGLPVQWIQGDLRDVAGFAPALAGAEVLFHAGAYFREYFQPGDHWETLQAINVTGTIELLTAAERHEVRKAIYVSSGGIIGTRGGGQPGNESAPLAGLAQRNLYFKSKVLAERAVDEFLRTHSLPVVLILPGWMFGPGDTAPTNSGQLVLDVLQRRLPGIPSGGNSIADARDVAAAMLAAMDRGASGDRYIVGGVYHTLETVFKTLQQVSGVPTPRLPIPYPMALAFAYASEFMARWQNKRAVASVEGVRSFNEPSRLDSGKAARELGVTFRPLAETLRDEVAWFRAHGYV
jgi:dihydroflavonol-4-reductase